MERKENKQTTETLLLGCQMIRFACVDVPFIFYFLKIDRVEAGSFELFKLRRKPSLKSNFSLPNRSLFLRQFKYH